MGIFNMDGLFVEKTWGDCYLGIKAFVHTHPVGVNLQLLTWLGINTAHYLDTSDYLQSIGTNFFRRESWDMAGRLLPPPPQDFGT